MKEKNSLLKSLVALLLIAACLWATQWQFQRGIDRHDKNSQIAEHIQLSETKLEQAIGDVTSNEWRTVKVSGTFEPTHQILLRNR